MIFGLRVALIGVALLLAPPAFAARTALTAPTTFWITPSGVDAGSTCAQTAPCATLQYAATMVQQNYDLGGQTVTFNACGLGDATYNGGVSVDGPADFVGHADGPGQIIFVGDPANPAGCLIRPTSGYCFGAAFGAQYEIQGFKCDQSLDPGQDEIAVGQGAHIVIDGFIFGDDYNPGNDLTVVAATVDFASGYSAQKSIVQTTASFAAGSSSMTVGNAAGIVIGMMATGAGMPIQNLVTGVSGNTVTINAPSTAAESGSTIYFLAGGQTHMDVANGGTVLFDTNCGQAPFDASIGWAGYYDSFVHVAELGSVDLGATWSGNIAGYSYSVHTNGVLDTCGGIMGQGPGPVDTGGQVH